MRIGNLETSVIEAGQGKDVVLLHGIGNTKEVWIPFITAVGGYYHFIAYDQRLHGGAYGVDNKYSLDDFAEDLRNVITQMTDGHPIVMAHSFGCDVLQRYMQLYEDMPVIAILLNGTVKTPEILEGKIDHKEIERRIFLSMQRQTVMNIFSPSSVFIAPKPYLPMVYSQSIKGMFNEYTPDNFEILKENLVFDYTDANHTVASEKHPVVYTIGGTFDELITPAEIQELAHSYNFMNPWWIPSTHMSPLSNDLIPVFWRIAAHLDTETEGRKTLFPE